MFCFFFFFQAEDGIRDADVTGVQTCALPICTFGIRVYTIGVGSIGTAPFPINTVFGQQVQDVEVRIDEAMLTEIAEITGGSYFRATDKAALQAVYEEIDQMEKNKIQVQEYTRHAEEFLPYVLLALLFLLMELALRNTVLRTLP